MATEQMLQQLEITVTKLKAVDSEKLLRKGLGEESLDPAFQPTLKNIQDLTDFVTRHAPLVHDTYVTQAKNTLQQLVDLMTAQAARPPAEYIAERNSFLISIDNTLQQAQLWKPYFAATAVLERGFLEDEGIRREYARVVEDLKTQTAATISTIKEEADKAVQGAKTLADEIEARARKTATKISVEEAQNQFSAATTNLSKKLKTWAWITAAAVIILLSLPFVFMAWPLPEQDTWHLALYHTVLRVFVLSAAGAAAAFCFRMLRAHIHMVEKNLHRVRVANSIESFVNSALDPQQRDLILAKLCEAIVDFGDSGIIQREKDDMGSAAVSGELIGRILSSISPKRG